MSEDNFAPISKQSLNRTIFDILTSNSMTSIFSNSAWQPPTDVWETEKEIKVLVELAGISQKEIKLSLENTKLVINGIRKENEVHEIKTQVHQIEIGYGYFERVIDLSIRINKKQISANYQNGFLEILIKKPENRTTKQKSKEIKISVEN